MRRDLCKLCELCPADGVATLCLSSPVLGELADTSDAVRLSSWLWVCELGRMRCRCPGAPSRGGAVACRGRVSESFAVRREWISRYPLTGNRDTRYVPHLTPIHSTQELNTMSTQTDTQTRTRELIRLDVHTEDYAAARRAIRKAGGRIVSSSPSAYGYTVHYVMCGGAR